MLNCSFVRSDKKKGEKQNMPQRLKQKKNISLSEEQKKKETCMIDTIYFYIFINV